MSQELTSAPRIGAISIGSNDLHLLVASSDGQTTFDRQLDRSVLVELVGMLSPGGPPVLPPAALAQALKTLGKLVSLARRAGAEPVVAVGTDVLREAANGPAFCGLVAATLGIEASVISGQEEAGLDHAWATFPPRSEPVPLLIVDSGGGSTQVVLEEHPHAARAVSLPLGAGVLTQRFLAHDPPKTKELEALRTHVHTVVETLPSGPIPHAAILMGGSADHLVRLGAHPQLAQLTQHGLDQSVALCQQHSAAKLARVYQLEEPRARLLAAGAIILQEVLRRYQLETAVVKADDIRGGLIVRYAQRGQDWRANLALPAWRTATKMRSTAKHEGG